eukprot:11159368-Alexandrium_andersonii.AAC.1
MFAVTAYADQDSQQHTAQSVAPEKRRAPMHKQHERACKQRPTILSERCGCPRGHTWRPRHNAATPSGLEGQWRN